MYSHDAPPEKEHPFVTIGVCLLFVVFGYYLSRWGWGMIEFGFGLTEIQEGSRASRRDFSTWLMLGGGMIAVGLTFVCGACAWGWKAINALRRGEMVE